MIEGGRNRLWGYETTVPLSTKDKLKLNIGCLGVLIILGSIGYYVGWLLK